MKCEEIYKKHNTEIPFGGMTTRCNVSFMLDQIVLWGFGGELLVTKEEFLSIFSALKDEVLVSMLLSGKSMNRYFTEGIELRGLIIKIC